MCQVTIFHPPTLNRCTFDLGSSGQKGNQRARPRPLTGYSCCIQKRSNPNPLPYKKEQNSTPAFSSGKDCQRGFDKWK